MPSFRVSSRPRDQTCIHVEAGAEIPVPSPSHGPSWVLMGCLHPAYTLTVAEATGTGEAGHCLILAYPQEEKKAYIWNPTTGISLPGSTTQLSHHWL